MPAEVTLEAQPVPLRHCEGAILVADSRVPLDAVVYAYRDGMTIEQIVEEFPSVRLADAYAVMAFVLNHEKEVDEYLSRREKVGAAVRRANEERHPSTGVRERWLARQRPTLLD